jgi:signal transduction histidine kinase
MTHVAVMASGETGGGERSLEAKRDSTLQSVTAGLSTAATREDILRAILDDGGQALASSAAVAYLWSKDETGKRSLTLVAHVGVTEEIARACAALSIDSEFPVARSMREGQPLWLAGRALAENFPDFERTVGDAFARQALVALPLRVRGEVIAGLGFAFPEAHAFDQGERAFLTTLAERCESAMERALLYEESQTARAAAEQSRAEAEAMLRFNEIVAGILAHDLKNPVAAVLMNARLLRNGEPRERAIGERIVSSGERMTRMIDQILDWTRVRSDAGHVRLVRAECDLLAVAEEVVGELRTRTTKVEPAITLEAHGSLRGHWDADRLAQVVSNLVANGLDHAKGGGVTVRLDGQGDGQGDGQVDGKDSVRLVVENEGEIEDDLWPVIFEPFRGRAAGARGRGRGLGLGLYISRQIVLAHGGQIVVERAPGARIVFTVTLPRAAPT